MVGAGKAVHIPANLRQNILSQTTTNIWDGAKAFNQVCLVMACKFGHYTAHLRGLSWTLHIFIV